MKNLLLVPCVIALAAAAAAQPRIVTLDDMQAASERQTGLREAALQSPERTIAVERVQLRGLDTLNGTTRDLDLAVGETVAYGHLEVTVEACRVPEDDPEADAQAFLLIRDIREDRPRFAGWMFASSPALSALDHPRYDVWVLSCSNR
jgi:hypothetical protein